MKTIREMIPEYEHDLDVLRKRRAELLVQRENEPSFVLRHKITERIVLINKMLASSSAALAAMLRYGE